MVCEGFEFIDECWKLNLDPMALFKRFVYQTRLPSRSQNMSSAAFPCPRSKSPQLHLGSAQLADELASKCSTIDLHRDKMLMRLNIIL